MGYKASFILFVLQTGILLNLLAQKPQLKHDLYTLVYEKSQYGSAIPGDTLVVNYSNGLAIITNSPENEKYYVDYELKKTLKIIQYQNINYQVSTPFDSLPKPELLDGTETISGYRCKKLKYIIFSNTVEVWYTTDLPIKGSPSLNYVPADGLVVKSITNGNLGFLLKSVKKLKNALPLEPVKAAEFISESKYRALQINARYVTIPVFKNEQINFENGIQNPESGKTGITYRYSNGTILLKKIALPEMETGGSVFLRLVNRSNGDAYDRTGCVFTLSSKKEKNIMDAINGGPGVLPYFTDKNGEKYQGMASTDNYSTPIELMRFFTSFGVGHFNNKRPIDGYPWNDSVVYKHEITDLIPSDEKEIWIGVFIGNYDKGGHKISLDLMYYPPFERTKKREKYIYPLFLTLNVLEASGQNYGKFFKTDTLFAEFDLPDGIENLKLLFTTTGHGGWENGDEFNPKLNRVLIDGSEVLKIVPWRTDCASYRMSNPASGNFSNGLSSSDLSRSNWCPATITTPFQVPLNDLKPGKHRIQVMIDQGKDEGNSFSHWSVSGVLVGNK